MPARKRQRFTHSENTFYHAQEEGTEADDPGAMQNMQTSEGGLGTVEQEKNRMGNRR